MRITGPEQQETVVVTVNNKKSHTIDELDPKSMQVMLHKTTNIQSKMKTAAYSVDEVFDRESDCTGPDKNDTESETDNYDKELDSMVDLTSNMCKLSIPDKFTERGPIKSSKHITRNIPFPNARNSEPVTQCSQNITNSIMGIKQCLDFSPAEVCQQPNLFLPEYYNHEEPRFQSVSIGDDVKNSNSLSHSIRLNNQVMSRYSYKNYPCQFSSPFCNNHTPKCNGDQVLLPPIDTYNNIGSKSDCMKYQQYKMVGDNTSAVLNSLDTEILSKSHTDVCNEHIDSNVDHSTPFGKKAITLCIKPELTHASPQMEGMTMHNDPQWATKYLDKMVNQTHLISVFSGCYIDVVRNYKDKPKMLKMTLFDLLNGDSKTNDHFLTILYAHIMYIVNVVTMPPNKKKYAEILTSKQKNKSLLYLACMKHTESPIVARFIAEVMIQLNRNIDEIYCDFTQNSLIHILAEQGDSHVNLLAELLQVRNGDAAAFDINRKNFRSQTPLHLAVIGHLTCKSYIETIKLLVDHGATITMDSFLQKCFHYDVSKSSGPDFVQKRLSLNVPEVLNIQDNEGNTVLRLAYKNETSNSENVAMAINEAIQSCAMACNSVPVTQCSKNIGNSSMDIKHDLDVSFAEYCQQPNFLPDSTINNHEEPRLETTLSSADNINVNTLLDDLLNESSDFDLNFLMSQVFDDDFSEAYSPIWNTNSPKFDNQCLPFTDTNTSNNIGTVNQQYKIIADNTSAV